MGWTGAPGDRQEVEGAHEQGTDISSGVADGDWPWGLLSNVILDVSGDSSKIGRYLWNRILVDDLVTTEET